VLRAQIGVAGQNQRAAVCVLAEAVIEGARLKVGVDVEVLRARANMEVAAVRRQIRLGFIGPEGVKALLVEVLVHDVPEPLRRRRIGHVNVRAGLVIGQAVGGRAIGEVLKPALVQQEVVVAVLRNKARPDADHGLKAHGLQLLVHRRRVRPVLGIHVHLAHLGVVEPVDHHDVGGQIALAIALGRVEHLLLAPVAVFRLQKAVSRLGQHRRRAGQCAIALVELVVAFAGHHKERNPRAHLRGEPELVVEARRHGGLRGVVPQQRIVLVGDHIRHAEGGRGHGVVVVPAVHLVVEVIEVALLILAQTVVVRAVRRNKGGAHFVKRIVARPPVIGDVKVAVLVVRHRHLPAFHVQQHLAVGPCEGDVRAGRRAAKELAGVPLVRVGVIGHRMLGRNHRHHQVFGAVDVAILRALVAPAARVGLAGDAVAGGGERLSLEQAERNAHDVGRIRRQHDGAVAVGNDFLRCGLRGCWCLACR